LVEKYRPYFVDGIDREEKAIDKLISMKKTTKIDVTRKEQMNLIKALSFE